MKTKSNPLNGEHEPRALASRAPCSGSAFDYRGEFERLRCAVEQAVDGQFESRAANGVLESAVKLYAEMLPNKKIVSTVRVEVRPRLYEDQITQVIQAINISITGKKNCNKRDKSGNFVANNSPDIDRKLQDAHWHLRAVRPVLVEFDFTEDGEQINHRIVENG